MLLSKGDQQPDIDPTGTNVETRASRYLASTRPKDTLGKS